MVYTLRQIRAARRWGDLNRLSEVSLGRIYQRHLWAGHTSLAMLSVGLGEQPERLNKYTADRLHNQIRSAGITLSRQLALHQRQDGSWLTVRWLYMHGITLDQMRQLASNSEHDWNGYSGPETHGEFHVSGSVTHLERFPEFDPPAIAAWFAARNVFFEYAAGFFEVIRTARRTPPSASEMAALHYVIRGRDRLGLLYLGHRLSTGFCVCPIIYVRDGGEANGLRAEWSCTYPMKHLRQALADLARRLGRLGRWERKRAPMEHAQELGWSPQVHCDEKPRRRR